MKIAVITVLYHKIYKFNKQIQILKSISKDIDIVVINNLNSFIPEDDLLIVVGLLII